MNGKINSHRDLNVWKKAIEFSVYIYKETAKFPKEEKFGLISQMRRSIVSVASNIAEGASRNSRTEFIHFLYIARASASELETQITISEKLAFLDNTYSDFIGETEDLQKMLTALIKSLKIKE